MTSRGLVYAAIEHRETERIPYCIGFAADGREKLQAERGITDEEAFLDNDVIRVFPPWWQWRGLGPEWHGPDPPELPATVIGAGSYEEFFHTVEAVHAAWKYVLACIYGSHFEKAYFARGIENLLADLVANRHWARQFAEGIVRRNLVMLENLLGCPQIDGVLLGSDWGSQAGLLMSPRVWEEVIRPGEQAEYDLIKHYGKHVWIHSCGNITQIIPALVEMGVDVLNPVQPECMDIALLKREFGTDLTFWGGLSTQRTLPFGTPEDVRHEAREVRAILGSGGGLVFAPAQELQGDVPFANVEALLEVAREKAC